MIQLSIPQFPVTLEGICRNQFIFPWTSRRRSRAFVGELVTRSSIKRKSFIDRIRVQWESHTILKQNSHVVLLPAAPIEMFAVMLEFVARIALELAKSPVLMLVAPAGDEPDELLVDGVFEDTTTTPLPGINGLMNPQKIAFAPFGCK